MNGRVLHAVFDIVCDRMFFSWSNAREIQMSIAASKLEKIGHHLRRLGVGIDGISIEKAIEQPMADLQPATTLLDGLGRRLISSS